MPGSDSGEEANSVSAMFKAIQDQMAGLVKQNTEMQSKIADLTRQSIATSVKLAALESEGVFSFSAPGLLPLPSAAMSSAPIAGISAALPGDPFTAGYTAPAAPTPSLETSAVHSMLRPPPAMPKFLPQPSLPPQAPLPSRFQTAASSYSSAPRYHKLEFPTYDGSDDPLSWLNRCDQFFRGQRTEEDDTVTP